MSRPRLRRPLLTINPNLFFVLDARGKPILGHDFPTMSFGIYSGAADIETLREAIEVLSW
jgi:hypothetical protein